MLYKKYDVQRRYDAPPSAGTPEPSAFFVLDIANDHAAVPALLAYADAIEAEDPDLADDVRGLANGDVDVDVLRHPYGFRYEDEGV